MIRSQADGEAMDNNASSIAVVGVGNVLMGDEGVGVEVARRLRRMNLPRGVEVMDGGTLGLELAVHLADKEAIVFLDAIALEAEPGSVFRFEIDEGACLSTLRRSSHDGGLEELLRYLLSLPSKPKILLFGICPSVVEMRLGLSPAVQQSMDRIITRIIHELRHLNQECVKS